MSEPHVVVIPRVRFRAWDGIEPCEAPLARVVPLAEALAAEYIGDACILQYAPSDPEVAPRFPRLTKAALGYFELEPDDMPTLQVVLVDVDYENHEVPPDTWHEAIVERSPFPCGWYRTPHGLRLVYIPRQPVPIDQADSYISQLWDHLRTADIPVDEACKDWTRLSIAPRALGRDHAFGYEALAPIDWHPDELEVADPARIGPFVDRDFASVVESIPTKLSKTDLKSLGTSKLADLLYKRRLTAPEGQRHATLLSAARQIVNAFDTDDPIVPFHLLANAAQAMGKDLNELWGMCQWCCAHWAGVKCEREQAIEQGVAEMSEIMNCSPTEILSRVVIDAGKEYFVWDEERKGYSTGYTDSHQLLGALKRHAPELARDYYEGKGRPLNQIMRDLSTVADRVVYTYHDNTAVGYDKATYTFYQRLCREDRTLYPTYDAFIDRWLGALFGEDAEKGKDWLASVPDLSRPTCAFYLDGPPSIGKGMLSYGLARIWSKECAVTPYAELLATHNPSLKRSPIIYADEKVPQDVFAANDSSIFRRIIGNTGISIRDLYRSPATLDGYPRVLITANNEDALQIREELNVDDLEAIRIRIGYIQANDSARVVLQELADEQGFASTREMTESWVAGGRIARHVLWLSENRPITQGDRLVVEGWDSDLTRSLSTSAGAAGVIAEVIVQYMIDPDYPTNGIRWFGDHVYVNNTELGRLWKSVVRNDAERSPNSSRRLKALKALAGEQRARLDVYSPDGERRQLSYWKIPAKTLARLAHERNIESADVILKAAARKLEPKEDDEPVVFDSMNALAQAAQAQEA